MIDTTGCTVTLYSQDGCRDSREVRNWLESEAISFTERNVSHDPAAVVALSETGIFGTPLVMVCTHPIFGNRPHKIESTIQSCENRKV